MRIPTLLAAACLVGGVAVALNAGDARAQSGEGPALLRQESVGLELTPFAGLRTNSGSSVTAGLGGAVRLMRHRWGAGYWTPIQAGLFVGGDGLTHVILAHVMTEGGAVLRAGSVALEVGLGLGAGILGIAVGDTCDGTCRAGGKGAFVSPVVRLLFREAAPYSLGVVLRAEVPLAVPSGEGFGYFVAYGTMVLLGFDVAYGS
jgi:hypothetical protein